MLFRVLIFVAVLFPGIAWSQIQYVVSVEDADQQLVSVSAQFSKSHMPNNAFALPAWRTGKYKILDFVSHLTQLRVVDAHGKIILPQRQTIGEWQIPANADFPITVNYLVYANELASRTRHLDDSHLFFDPAALLVYPVGGESHPSQVQLYVPKKWRSVSGLKRVAAHRFEAPNYQVLADSPIESGLHQSMQYRQKGAEFEVVLWGDSNANFKGLVEDFKQLTLAALDIWDVFPFKRYVFIVHATDAVRGGTEHLNSTVMQWPRWRFASAKAYLDFLALASHEFVHTWNVKAYRPAEFTPYVWQQAKPSTLLWLAEGSTSYLQEWLLLRAGLMNENEFFKRMAKRLDSFVHKPGHRNESVAEASLNQWSRTGGHFAHNFAANIYAEGYVASLLLDLALVQQSEGKVNYRDVHRELYRRYALPEGIDEAKVIAVMSDLLGEDASPIWQQFVHQPLSKDHLDALFQMGLNLRFNGGTLAGWQAKWRVQPHSLTLTQVDRDGVAWKAGLTAGDILVAVDGYQINAANIEDRQAGWQPGQSLNVHLFRNGRLLQRQVKLALESKRPMKLQDTDSASDYTGLKDAWLGI